MNEVKYQDEVSLKGGYPKLHSAEYFGKQRDYWWNHDFLHLMEKRWDLKNVQNVLDVGCGIGHWGRLLSKILPKTTKVTGLDRQSEWIKEARENAKLHRLNDRYQYQEGDAHSLPFPDATFDMVTCQTVLIHIADVDRVLKEMIRVLKSGGIIITIEPNNIGRSLTLSTLDMDNPVDEILDVVRFWLLCERGKNALKEGYISLGDQLPGHFSNLGLKDIQVYIVDKARAFFPPYDTDEQKIVIEEIKDWYKKEFWIWDKEESKKFYLAGGGETDRFESYWAKAVYRQNERFLKGIESGKYATAGGKLNYCISGRKR